MDFPQPSIDLARQIGERYRHRNPRSLRKRAAELYDGHFYHIDYGFSEALRKGTCGQYLHEIEKETACFGLAGVLYLIAREAELKPQIWWGIDFIDLKDGQDRTKKVHMEHPFITVQTGKDTHYLIDPFMAKYGKVKHLPEKHEMVIGKDGRNPTRRIYGSMLAMDPADYLEKLEALRAPGGGRAALAATQRVRGKHGFDVHLTFDTDEQVVTSSMRMRKVHVKSTGYNGYMVFDLSTHVTQDGSFDWKDGAFTIYNAGAVGWDHHERTLTPFTMTHNQFKPFRDIFRATLLRRRKQLSTHFIGVARLYDELHGHGMNIPFDVNAGLEKYLHTQGLETTLHAAYDTLEKIACQHVAAACDHPETCEELAFLGAYAKASAKGQIHTDKEIDEVLRDLIEDESVFFQSLSTSACDQMLARAKLSAFSARKLDKEFDRMLNRESDQDKTVSELIRMRSKMPVSYRRYIDQHLFRSSGSFPEDDETLVLGSRAQVSQELLNLFLLEPIMLLKPYQAGIKRVLDISGSH